jgi:hypothetical protein
VRRGTALGEDGPATNGRRNSDGDVFGRRGNNSRDRRRCASSRGSTTMVCSSGTTTEPVRRAVRAGERRIEHEKREEGARGEGKGVRCPIYRREEGEREGRCLQSAINGVHGGEGVMGKSNGRIEAPITHEGTDGAGVSVAGAASQNLVGLRARLLVASGRSAVRAAWAIGVAAGVAPVARRLDVAPGRSGASPAGGWAGHWRRSGRSAPGGVRSREEARERKERRRERRCGGCQGKKKAGAPAVSWAKWAG